MKKSSKKWVLGMLILLITIELVFVLWIVRFFSERQIDDVTPGIPCDKEIMEKADVFYVIPKFENKSITENMSWCNQILGMNKTLEMHGVYHTYNEFETDRDKTYLGEGVDIFERCFGFKPESFKAPQMKLSSGNKVLVGEEMQIDGWWNQLIHKAYHCNDSGLWPNWFVNVF
jgi:hypothetical protein